MKNQLAHFDLVIEKLNERNYELLEAERRLENFKASFDDIPLGPQTQRHFKRLVAERDRLHAQVSELGELVGALSRVPGTAALRLAR